MAFVFPGQGAQYIGMGKEIIENFNVSQMIYEKSKAVLDFDLDEICFAEQEKIHITQYTQPALLTISIAILAAVESFGIKPDYVAGLSLGEYTALVANGALDFETAVSLVRKRGQFMEEAAAKTKGTMAAIIGLDQRTIEEICQEVNGLVGIANYNSPSQIVIAGEVFAVEEAGEKIAQKGGKVIFLKVSGAFHSLLMEEASGRLEEALAEVDFQTFETPYTTNVTGGLIHTTENIPSLLVQQVKASVRWETCIRTLIAEGVDTFVEIGPGKTLSGLIKKIDRSIRMFNVEDVNSLNKLREVLEEKSNG